MKRWAISIGTYIVAVVIFMTAVSLLGLNLTWDTSIPVGLGAMTYVDERWGKGNPRPWGVTIASVVLAVIILAVLRLVGL